MAKGLYGEYAMYGNQFLYLVAHAQGTQGSAIANSFLRRSFLIPHIPHAAIASTVISFSRILLFSVTPSCMRIAQ